MCHLVFVHLVIFCSCSGCSIWSFCSCSLLFIHLVCFANVSIDGIKHIICHVTHNPHLSSLTCVCLCNVTYIRVLKNMFIYLHKQDMSKDMQQLVLPLTTLKACSIISSFKHILQHTFFLLSFVKLGI
jgi:hypothetical protein